MTVLIAFLLGVFVFSAWNDVRGRPVRLRFLVIAVILVSASFYSMRVIS